MTIHYDFTDRVAVVTGGAGGIGASVARRLLRAGASLSCWDLNPPRGVSDLPGQEMLPSNELAERFDAQAVDVCDYASVEAARDATLERFGRIDILINSAGITGPNAMLWEYPLEQWRRVNTINLDGSFYCCRALVPGMIERGYGRIINLASVAGKEGNATGSAYSAAKAGVIAMTKSLGKELAAHDIAVNCITPAAARTALFDQMSEEYIQTVLAKIPRGRFVEVDEITAMITWMCSEENSFTTAGVFDLSGGRATY